MRGPPNPQSVPPCPRHYSVFQLIYGRPWVRFKMSNDPWWLMAPAVLVSSQRLSFCAPRASALPNHPSGCQSQGASLSSNQSQKSGSPDPTGVSTGGASGRRRVSRNREGESGWMGTDKFDHTEKNNRCVGQMGFMGCTQKTAILFYNFCP